MNIVNQIVRGNEEAFRELYVKYKPIVCKFVYSFTSDSDLTDDIVQDVFIAVWLNRKNLDPNKSILSYLMTIARNKVFDYFKETSRKKEMLEQNWLLLEKTRNETEEVLNSLELNRLVDAAISQLSSRKKAIFELSKLKGKTHAEVAYELGISQNTVKNHMVESLKFIKEFLSDHGEVAFSLSIFLLFR
ncbi:RNA polymerase sigma factor [Maribellus sp. CM-23]|uniref:RNA polymerase sigma factor n=1 Tax=Maribellus sp. CM-23 TaxID=2781026 RepID=UPI0021D3F2F1|nr:RNA polymerase sigma-70 factor [Maribellus sp. CM-23]